MKSYNHQKIEKKWQEKWQKDKLYEVEDLPRRQAGKNLHKFYSLMEFPYPSGNGLHVGHVRGFTAMDIISRKRRRDKEGFNVLYPIGWDAFGLPAENYAIKTGVHPAVTTKKNIENYKGQMKSLGMSFDWSREISTIDPDYYKWTQWIFLQFFKKGLAYKKKMPINWCADCKIGLANEEVVGGVCERCGGEILKKEKEQWMLAITKYADRLINDLEKVDYPERVKTQQVNWIGRSEGTEISFKLQASSSKLLEIKIFTTRPDTLFGATYLVISPEHEIILDLKSKISNLDEVEDYIKKAKAKTDIERTTEGKEKTGIELQGVKAINPGSGEEIPIFVADYVLAHYGTGAIMAVPAHDARDFEFANKFGLEVKEVIEPVTGIPQKNPEHRKSIVALVKNPKNNKILSINWGKEMGGNLFIGGGLKEREDPIECARREIKEETGYMNLNFIGKTSTIHHNYFAHSKNKAREIDAIGIYFELENEKKAKTNLEENEKGKFKVEWITVDETDKKVKDDLHKIVFNKFIKKQVYIGKGILTNSGEFDGLSSEEAREKISKKFGEKKVTYKLRDWVFSRQRYWGEPIPIILCAKCGPVAVPEKDLPVVLPELKDFKPTDDGVSPLEKASEWLKVDCPECGEKAMRETDVMPNWAGSSWYFMRYIDPLNQTEFASSKALKKWMPVDWYNGGMEHTTLHLLYSRFWYKFLFDQGLVPGDEPYKKRTSHGFINAEDGSKMSKSKGNVINPNELVDKFGADTLRIYEMFIGPFEQNVPWSADGLIGPRRFLEKVWKGFDKVEDSSSTSLDEETESLMNETIKKVSSDIEEMKFNTAISQLMVFFNGMIVMDSIPREVYKTFLQLLAPFAPHITEELWEKLGEKQSIHLTPWLAYDKTRIARKTQKIVIQIDGKTRDIIETEETDEETLKQQALSLDSVKKRVSDEEIEKIIYVPERLINIVTRQSKGKS